MLWSNRKLTQTVNFTEDTADQTLLEAIEQELTLSQYQTFGNLCKQALWQFLSLSGNTAPAAPTQGRGLEDQVYQLQQQLSQLENKLLAEESNRFSQLQQQLSQMTQQINQLQGSINHAAMAPIAAQNSYESSEVTEIPAETAPPIEHDDPVLARLSALVDDF